MIAGLVRGLLVHLRGGPLVTVLLSLPGLTLLLGFLWFGCQVDELVVGANSGRDGLPGLGLVPQGVRPGHLVEGHLGDVSAGHTGVRNFLDR